MIEEKLTPAIRAVKEAFAEKLSYFPEYFGFGCIPYIIVEEAMSILALLLIGVNILKITVEEI